jgi:hypothetical protein
MPKSQRFSGFDPSILWNLRGADEAVLNKVHKNIQKAPLSPLLGFPFKCTILTNFQLAMVSAKFGWFVDTILTVPQGNFLKSQLNSIYV